MLNLDQWLDKLRTEQPTILVEGMKDKQALLKLGLSHVISLRARPLYQVVEHIATITRTCLILTDLDNEGKKLYAHLRTELQKHGIKIDDRFRHYLFKETTLRQIEGLHTYTTHLNQTSTKHTHVEPT